MLVEKIPQGPIGANTYIVFDENSKEAVLVDLAGDICEIKPKLEKLGANLKYVLLTHAHFDHVLGLSTLKKEYPQAKVYLHKDDEILLENVPKQCAMFGFSSASVPSVDVLFDEDEKLKLGEFDIKIIHTKGHSKGSTCYLIDNELFSGDTLFYEEIGRCDLPGGSFSEIEKSIREKLFTLDEKITVHPGHGQDSTIGHEIKYNAYFGENSRY